MKNFSELQTHASMQRMRSTCVNAVLTIAAMCVMCLPATAQVGDEVLDSISTPDQVETSIGELRFLDGAPHPETAEKVYDYPMMGSSLCSRGP